MKAITFILSGCILLISCMPEEDLPIRNVGEAPEYFIECYCKPGNLFVLSATTVLPISEKLEIDYSKEMQVTIHTDREIQLTHALYTLPGSDFIYNYGSKERLQTIGLDSLHLSILTKDGKSIHASTEIPSAVSIYNQEYKEDEVILRFYTSELPDQNYYICSAEAVLHDTIIDKEIYYLDYSEYHTSSLTEQSLSLPQAPLAEKIILSLKRITRANYNYQISLKVASSANQSSITTPVPLKGNLQGALGIFTCYTEDRMEILINDE